MSASLPSHIPIALEQSFSKLSRRLFVLTLFRGLGRWLTGVVCLLAVVLLSDWLFDWSSGVRTCLLWGSIGLSLVAALMWIIIPLTRSLSPVEQAALIDAHYPELRERLMATVEFCDPDLPEEYKGSAEMRARVVQEALSSLPQVQVEDSLPLDRMRTALMSATFAIFALCLPFLVGSSHYRLLWTRLLVPAGNYGSATNLYFEIDDPDRIVARGSSVEFQVTPRWQYFETSLPESVWMMREDERGQVDRSRLILDEENQVYELTLPAVHQDFDYHIAAEGTRTPEFHINVEDAPEILTAQVEIEPPAYTGRAVETYSTITGRMNVFERSRIRIDLTLTKPVETVEFRWLDNAVAIDESSGRPAERSLPAVTLNPGRDEATIDFVADVHGSYELKLQDEFGLQNQENSPHTVAIIRDQAPELQLQTAAQNRAQVRPSDRLDISVQASDDIGIGELELHLLLAEEREEVVFANLAALGRDELNYTFKLDLASLGVKDGDRLTWRMRAADERPIPGPNEVWTSPRVLSIANDAPPPGQADVEQRQERWIQELKSLREQLEANAAFVADVERDARKSQQENINFSRGREVPPLAEQQWDIAGRLETLSLEFASSQLYHEMTDVLQKLSREDLSPLAEELKTFPQRDFEEQPDLLAENAKGVKEVAEHLKQLEEVLALLAEIEKDLLELDRLSEESEELAENALELDRQQKELSEELDANPELKENPEFLEKADQLEQSFDALAEDQQKLTDSLQDLLEKRPELLNAARQQEIDRLKDLAEQARNLAEPQEELAQQLEAEAKQLARESKQQQSDQEEFIRNTEELLGVADQHADRAALPQLDRSAQAAADREFQEGNLSAAAESQQQFARELQRLADDLEAGEALPKDTQSLLKKLAEEQQKLTEEIRDVDEDAKPNAAQTKRDLSRRQEALQSALRNLKLPEDQQAASDQISSKMEQAGNQLLSEETPAAIQNAQAAANELEQLAAQVPENSAVESNASEADAAQAAREARRIGDKIEKLREETDRLAQNPTEKNAAQKREKLQKIQQELQAETAKITPEVGRFPQREALQALQEAGRNFENDLNDSSEQMRQAEDALRALEEQARAQAEANKQSSEAEMTPAEVAQQLRQLADQQQQLAGQVQQSAQERSVSPQQQTAAGQKLSELQQKQDQLAEESAKIALDSVRNEGPTDPATQQALQAAREADQAAQQLRRGQLQEAAKAGEESSKASGEMAQSISEQPESEELANQVRDLASRQQQLAEELQQLSRQDAVQQTARNQAQEQLSSEADELAKRFDLSANKLLSDPFQLQQESGQAEQAEQSSRQASEQMKSSSRNEQAANPGEASQQARQASRSLQDAANAVDPQMIAESPVPQEVGSQVTDAFQNLKQAQELLQQQAGQSQVGESTPPPSADSSQQQAKSQQPQSKQGDSPSQNQNGDASRQKPQGTQQSPLQQTAQQLQEAAQQLQQAAQQMKPAADGGSQQQADSNNSSSSQNSETNSQVAQPKAGTDLERIELELEKLKKRNWGQLPGSLQTEIMQSRQKSPNAEYAPLIKRYFEAIARDQTIRQSEEE